MGKNKILIHIPPRIYFGGDVIYGVVELLIEHKIKYRGVRFLFAASERTHVQVGKQHYYEHLIFLSYRLDLMGAPRHDRHHAKAEEMMPGIYRFPFAVVLPQFLPPSWKHWDNHITYSATAYVDIPMGFDLKKKVDLRIDGNQVDPLQFAILRPPPPKENHKSFLFASGKLYMYVGIQTSNYFVGDTVHVTMKVDNDSTKNVDDIKIVIRNVRVVHACGFTNSSVHRVHKQKYNRFIGHETKEQFLLDFHIPYLPPSLHSRFIKSIYYLEVRLDVPWAIDLSVSFPIEIMGRDPKVAHLLPPPGPLMSPSPSKYITPSAFDQQYLPQFPVVVMSPYERNPQLPVQNFPPPPPVPQPTFQPAPVYYAPNYEQYAPSGVQSGTNTAQAMPVIAQTQAQDPALVAAPVQAQDSTGAPVSLTKKEQATVAPPKQLTKVQSLEHLPAAPPLYPEIDGYEFPPNMNAAIVEYGHYQVDDDEKKLLS